MQNARNLRVLAEARKLAVGVYALTRHFPLDERFGLTVQMRRAAVSVGSNVAEGCGRSGNKALIAFLHNSLGSASELEFQLDLSQSLDFCDGATAAPVHSQIETVKAMLSRLVASLRDRPD